MNGVIWLRRFCVVALSAGVVVASAGCGSLAPYAATVGFPTHPVKIDRADFEKELKALNDNQQLQAASGGNGLSGAGKKTVDPRLAAGWLTAVIYDKLITHEFERRHLTITADDTDAGKSQLTTQFGNPSVADAFPGWFQKRLVDRNARAVAVRSALSGIDLSDASLRKYYDAHQDEFSQNCLSHILVKTKAEADAALARIKGGEDFAAVAKSVSIDTGSGAKGGDLGCNPKGVFVPEFDKAASELPIGQISDPVQTQYGWHIILVRERKTATFDAAKEQVKAAVNAASQGAFRQFLQQAVTTARVTIDKRYGTFQPPATGQPPEVVPPRAPKPNTERTDNLPTTTTLPGELPGTPGNPTQRVG
ncbi:MAG TPA: peptidylprolyl isomerase [Acidimicrobiia bacterium]|nr:peptidylprolyl isomerase [Acidimicrobiia bacterium]